MNTILIMSIIPAQNPMQGYDLLLYVKNLRFVSFPLQNLMRFYHP